MRYVITIGYKWLKNNNILKNIIKLLDFLINSIIILQQIIKGDIYVNM